jgi:hypothetical protein
MCISISGQPTSQRKSPVDRPRAQDRDGLLDVLYDFEVKIDINEWTT